MKPCPFCGSRARVQAYRKIYGRAWARVMCTNKGCAARGPTFTAHISDSPVLGSITYEELKGGAERCWNLRAEEAQHVDAPGV